jgi:hypothetical protein
MNHFKFLILWLRNKVAVRRGATLPGVGCTATSEEEMMTAMDVTWHRSTGAQHFDEMKPLKGNLRTD